MSSTARHIYFGGSFYPPHCAHSEMIRHALARDRAAALHIVPTKQNPLKRSPGAPIELIDAWMQDLADELAYSAFSRCQLELLEFHSEQTVNYTIETLAALKRINEPWVLLVGSDAAESLPKWREPQRLLQEFSEVWIVPRTGAAAFDRDRCAAVVRAINATTPIIFLDHVADISSTELRDEAASHSLEQFISPRVLAVWKKFNQPGHSS